jgi:predicted metal-dependent phosphoesterase TrpH
MRPSRPLVLLVTGTAALAVAVPLAGSALAGRNAGAVPDPTQTPLATLYAGTAGTTPNPPMPPLGTFEGSYSTYVGSMHEHSSYSDGFVPTTPSTYYASAKSFGLDFMGGSDHSDFLGVPLSTSQYCAPDPNHPTDRDPATQLQDTAACPEVGVEGVTKWQATKDQARAATTKDFGAIQGFEWTSDVYGHINVYFSSNYANAKATQPTPQALYEWLSRRRELGGGSDGVFTFNHPGDKDQLKPVRQQTGIPDETSRNWNDFAYVPQMDQQAVGLEVWNSMHEFGSTKDTDSYPEGYYAHVLDKGWHVAPVGAEDLGHDRGDQWGNPQQAKTVLLATNRSPAALKAAMLARRMYAVRYGDVRLGLTVDGELMGSRLTRPAGAPLSVAAYATRPGHTGLTLELVTTRGAVVESGTDQLTTVLHPTSGSSWVFLRVKEGNEVLGYSAPVWVSAAKGGHTGEWLAGDLHVHTCYSHDAYCPQGAKGSYFARPTGTPVDQVPLGSLPLGGPLDTLGMGDSNTDLSLAYTLGGTVQERFAEAAFKGLDYLAITDHHADPQATGTESSRDPGFGTSGVVGVPGYENSIHGHAQMLGATRIYPAGSGSTADVNAMADALRADGGIFQANHPADGIDQLKSCSDADARGLMWGYGYDVPVESVEVWNTNHVLQRPLPASAQNDDAVFFWECMLQRGLHVAATGGGDSHWVSIAAAQGVGNPTTWVFATERSARGVLDAIRQGRTSISLQSPLAGATQLVLEADADRDGQYESMVGDTVPPGTPMRVRALGVPGTGMVEVRANGTTLLTDTPLAPGGSVDFTSPGTAGWVRASLYSPDGAAQRKQLCDPVVGGQTTLCRYEVGLLAMTSAIYLQAPVAPPSPTPCPTAGHSTVCPPLPDRTTPPVPAAGAAGLLALRARRVRRRR